MKTTGVDGTPDDARAGADGTEGTRRGHLDATTVRVDARVVERVDVDEGEMERLHARCRAAEAAVEAGREREAREARRREEALAATREELEATSATLARSRAECRALEAECEALGGRVAEAREDERRKWEASERTLADVCRALTRFASRCAEVGLIEEDVARAVEDNPRIWITPDATRRERSGDLFAAVLDAHAATCAEYESKVALAKAQPPSTEDVEEYERQIKEEVERVLSQLELEFRRSELQDSPNSSITKRLYRTPDVKSSSRRRSSSREVEAERRELQETLQEVQRQMHQLSESSKAIETELREQLGASRRESESLRVELESVLEERKIIVSKLEEELQRYERAQHSMDDRLADVARRAKEDLEQEQRRFTLAMREKEAEIGALRERAEDSKRQVDDLNAELKRLSDTLAKQRQLKEKLEEQLAGSEARIEGLLQEIDAMDAASAQASMHVSNAMASASEAHQRSLQEMRAKQAEAEAYIESLDSRLGALEEERGMLRRELERAYSREKEVRVRLQESEQRSNELTGEINALLEQEARRVSVRESSDFMNVAAARSPARAARTLHMRVDANATASASTKKLHVHEVSDDDSEGEEFVVVRRRAATAPNSPYMVANSPRESRRLNGLSAVSSALTRARAEFIEARSKRDTFAVRRLDDF